MIEHHLIEDYETINIAKLNLAKSFYLERSIFNDEYLQEMNKEYEEYIIMFVEWIDYRKENE